MWGFTFKVDCRGHVGLRVRGLAFLMKGFPVIGGAFMEGISHRVMVGSILGCPCLGKLPYKRSSNYG